MVADAAFPTLSAPAWPGKLTRFGAWAIAVGALLVVVSGPLNRFTAIGFQVQEQILAQLRDHHYPAKILFGIRLSIEEAIINAIKHGNGMDPGKHVTIAWRIDEASVRVEIEDEGPGFIPAEVPDPTAEENLDRPCGRGIMLMKSFMSRVEFNARGNRVILENRRDP